MNGPEVKGLPQPPDRHAAIGVGAVVQAKIVRVRNRRGPRKPKLIGPKERYRKSIHGAKFGPKKKRRGGVKKFGPVYNAKKAGLGPKGKKYGPRFNRKKAGLGPRPKRAKKTRAARKRKAKLERKRRMRNGTARRRSKAPSWFLRMAMRAIKRYVGRAAPKDLRNHGYKGVKRPGRTGLGGR